MEFTKLVRKVMREHGKRSVYTNKLKRGRTVKCYVGDEHPILAAEIRNALWAAGLKTYEIRWGPRMDWAPGDSLIVEIPYEAQPE